MRPMIFPFALAVLWISLLCGRPVQAKTLTLAEVERSVSAQYPPYLITLIERDIAAGRLRQAQGAFDLGFLGKGTFNPSGYYEGSTGDFQLDQALPFWGGNVFAGYRVSSGLLASYDKNRTQVDGELRAGLRLNLLRDGSIDRRRADLWKARLDTEIVDPVIQRQHLDVIRSAGRAYYNWVAQGMRLTIAEEQLRIAQDRVTGIAEMTAKGQLAPIVSTDNERLVVSRQLAVVQAQRRLEAASLELSLFYRDAAEAPVSPTRDQLPTTFPPLQSLLSEKEKKAPHQGSPLGDDLVTALELRPELKRIRLVQSKVTIDQRLADNGLLPYLDFTAAVSQNLGDGPYKDRETTEAGVGVELKVPLQRNDAKGRVAVAQAEMDRLKMDERFARDRIAQEVQDAHSALRAAQQQISLTQKNVDLALVLQRGEQERFAHGATDLLTVQIREQATFDGKLLHVDAQAEFFRTQIDLQTATAQRLRQWKR